MYVYTCKVFGFNRFILGLLGYIWVAGLSFYLYLLIIASVLYTCTCTCTCICVFPLAGPIFQHEFACEHGGEFYLRQMLCKMLVVCVCVCVCKAVLPNRCEHARNLAMAVRRDVWDSYQQR